jgi:hypothetical protein
VNHTNYKMRNWVWQKFQSLYDGRSRTQTQALRDLIPYIGSLTWSDLKHKTRKVKMPPETKDALKNKVDEIDEQPGNKTTRIAVLLCAVAKMLADEGAEGAASADDAIEARKLTPAELAQQFAALSRKDKQVLAKMIGGETRPARRGISLTPEMWRFGV